MGPATPFGVNCKIFPTGGVAPLNPRLFACIPTGYVSLHSFYASITVSLSLRDGMSGRKCALPKRRRGARSPKRYRVGDGVLVFAGAFWTAVASPRFRAKTSPGNRKNRVRKNVAHFAVTLTSPPETFRISPPSQRTRRLPSGSRASAMAS